MSLPAQTLGSWVRIPFEAVRSDCVHSVFVLSYIGSGLATGWSHVKGALPTLYKIKISELISSEWAQARESNPSRKKKKKKV
jgi:hypothetical protein